MKMLNLNNSYGKYILIYQKHDIKIKKKKLSSVVLNLYKIWLVQQFRIIDNSSPTILENKPVSNK